MNQDSSINTTQLTFGNRFEPGVNHPIESSNFAPALRHPVGTFSVYSLPPNIQENVTAGVQIVPVRNMPLAQSFDARQKWPGLISGPLDQERCGSCWAFSTSSVLSDRLRITNPNDRQLRTMFEYRPNDEQGITESYPLINNVSPYQLVSCDLCNTVGTSLHPIGQDTLCNKGCSGGVIADAFDYLVHRGANSILATNPVPSNPSNPNTFRCDFNPQDPVYRASTKYIVAQIGLLGDTRGPSIRERCIKEEVFLHGPVSAAYTVYRSFYTFFEQNPRGIYGITPQPANDTIVGGHAIVIIGWGGEGENRYWLVRNSWGERWGDGGYFRIKYDWHPPNASDSNNHHTIGIMDEVWAVSTS
ncbi:hypothetical protein BH23THE1_BH23THE1_31040 [soil metagenome]